MRGPEEISAAGVALVRGAEPLRNALTNYFRKRIRDASEAEDLVQEVFMRIASRTGTAPVENLAGYVYQTAASVLADRSRRRRARSADVHVLFDADQHSEEDFDPHRILTGREDLRQVTKALLSLPERTRVIFVLCRLEGLRQREIAQQLGISVKSVEKHLARAMQHLGKVFEDQS